MAVHAKTKSSGCGCGPKQIGALEGGDAPATPPTCKKVSLWLAAPIGVLALVGGIVIAVRVQAVVERGEPFLGKGYDAL